MSEHHSSELRSRIYYATREPFSIPKDGSVYDAPADGVIAIAEEDPTSPKGWNIMNGGEGEIRAIGFYLYECGNVPAFEAGWYAADREGYFQYMLRPGPKRVLYGVTVSNQAFQDIMKRVIKEGLG